mmetsp:Transcript_13597/g.32859  ORF Transcript_13597/g.32859 Transcript_13597/m.32859 type:complete len:216 (+) Transcript_13597:895-1542(+)
MIVIGFAGSARSSSSACSRALIAAASSGLDFANALLGASNRSPDPKDSSSSSTTVLGWFMPSKCSPSETLRFTRSSCSNWSACSRALIAAASNGLDFANALLGASNKSVDPKDSSSSSRTVLGWFMPSKCSPSVTLRFTRSSCSNWSACSRALIAAASKGLDFANALLGASNKSVDPKDSSSSSSIVFGWFMPSKCSPSEILRFTCFSCSSWSAC